MEPEAEETKKEVVKQPKEKKDLHLAPLVFILLLVTMLLIGATGAWWLRDKTAKKQLADKQAQINQLAETVNTAAQALAAEKAKTTTPTEKPTTQPFQANQ